MWVRTWMKPGSGAGGSAGFAHSFIWSNFFLGNLGTNKGSKNGRAMVGLEIVKKFGFRIFLSNHSSGHFEILGTEVVRKEFVREC